MNRLLSAQFSELDALLEREILRLRARYQLSLDEFRGLYVSDEQVDRLVAQASDRPELAVGPALARPASGARAAHPPWRRIAEGFGLSALDEDLLLLAAAAEFDLKYETLYAYLNNDVTRKWPTVELARRLLGDQAEVLRALAPDATLPRYGLLERIDPPAARPGMLNSGFVLRPTVAAYLRGVAPIDPRFAAAIRRRAPGLSWRQLPFAEERIATLQRLPLLVRSERQSAVLLFVGPPGSGRAATAEALARELGLPVCRLDLSMAIQSGHSLGELPASLTLQLQLEPALLHIEGLDALLRDDGRPNAAAPELAGMLLGLHVPVVISARPEETWGPAVGGRRAVEIRFGEHDYRERVGLCQPRRAHARVELPATEVRALSDRFALTAGQMRDAIATAQDLSVLEGRDGTLDASGLATAARLGSDQALGRLAVKVDCRHSWDDLVLSPSTFSRLQEMAAAIRYRHIVYSEWGFAQRGAAATNVKALFTGPSGVGKSTCAGVIARELGLNLYRIDLSGVVSKYIGETEKNLDRIFRAARSANAIILLDEAEAILGKRSEVKDAHDRYANIEVAYLLQKLEEHDGVVILTTNLRRNIDEAFNRRMQFVIDFPRPSEPEREELWRLMFPPQSPLGDDVDFRFLAKQFDLAGGDIRNVALDAAFLAAQNGRVIDMRCVVEAMARQLAKQGKTATGADFKHYQRLLGEAGKHDWRS
jgi:AAA+ superfamily predicted ATPase